ncbi:protein enabled-like protein [Cucumis melo var. makuwa]|uniref:Protein enabled-like protein n=1 Tax=Cucumis melo var. makuwa TaxID=1194695 RepID=A0A5A7T6U2_CUCMM|nr:protein enabled-like protein [Cucumis melo var. makuwa]TYK24175.1 protein enabled-like protein [Cucumis melo var. makuwa]
MENQRSALLSWAYFFQGKVVVCALKQNIEELRHSLFCATLELEQTRVAVQEELRKRDEQLIHLKDLFSKAIRERDEANEKFQKLLIEKLLLQQQQQRTDPHSGISSIEDEPKKGIDSINGFSLSDCEESIVSSPAIDPIPPPQFPPAVPPPHIQVELVPEKPLPEKGKLLEAVMKAGPLLQTLLVAGPLPEWRHPPPPLESFEIPPVTIPSTPPSQMLRDSPVTFNGSSHITNCGNRKRAFLEGSDSPTETKCQRLAPC